MAVVGHEATVVAGGDDLVAGADELAADLEAGGLDLSESGPHGPDPQREGVGGGVIGRHGHDGLAGGPGADPALEGGVDGLLPGAAVDAAVFLVLMEHGQIAGPETEAGAPFPLGAEPPHARQFDGRRVVGEEAEETTGVDGAELAVVPDGDDLRPGGVGQVDEAGEVCGADLAGLVDHDDLAGPQGVAGSGAAGPGVLVEELGEGGCRDVSLAGEDVGGDGGDGQSPDGNAVRVPGVGRRPDGPGLARCRPGRPGRRGPHRPLSAGARRPPVRRRGRGRR